MGEFEIAYKNIVGYAEKIGSCSKEVKRQERRVSDVLRQLRFQEDGTRGMQQALFGITESLHRQQEQMRQYGNVLVDIARAYESAESSILAKGTQRFEIN